MNQAGHQAATPPGGEKCVYPHALLKNRRPYGWHVADEPPPYRVPAASPLRPFSLARHSHSGTGPLSAHRPRVSDSLGLIGRPRNATGQSALRCPAQRELKVGRERWAKA